MKAMLIATLPAFLIVSACTKNPEEGRSSTGATMSANEVAAKMDAVKLKPGQWEATQEIVHVEMSGLPEGVPPSAVNRMTGQRTSTRYCLSPEQAANPSAQFLSAQNGVKCDNSDMRLRDGKMTADMNCAVPQQPGGKMHMTMAGTYLPDRYDVDMTVDTSGLANGVGIRMKMKTSGKRIGECPAAAPGVK